mmetsp:Transcript_17620/g.40376  ORF Transcript_17620/g.40376 Transcript_17620/m.40376 type:complete len:240 (+) Transcript_17620:825-1544(+)
MSAPLCPLPRSRQRTTPSCEQESKRCVACGTTRIPATGRLCGSNVTTGLSSPASTSHRPTRPHVSPAATSSLEADGCTSTEKMRSGTSLAISSSSTERVPRSKVPEAASRSPFFFLVAELTSTRPRRARKAVASSLEVAPVETLAAPKGTLGLRTTRWTCAGGGSTGLSGSAAPSTSRFCRRRERERGGTSSSLVFLLMALPFTAGRRAFVRKRAMSVSTPREISLARFSAMFARRCVS